MKIDFLIYIIAVGSIISSSDGACCDRDGQRNHLKKSSGIENRTKRGKLFLIPYDNKIDSESSENASERTLPEIQEVAKFRGNKEKNDAKPYIRVETESTSKDLTKRVVEALNDDHKRKRNSNFEDLRLTTAVHNVNGPCKTRQKKYECYCKELNCQNKDNGQYLLKGKYLPSTQQFITDDYEGDTSAEEVDRAQKGISTSRFTTEPTNYNLPFTNNMNFDQRVQQTPRQFPYYNSQQSQAHPNQPFPIYQYNPYIVAHPMQGIHTGLAPDQQNYAAGATKVAVPRSFISNIFSTNFPAINKCITLFGRRICLASSTKKPPIDKVGTIDLSDDATIKPDEDEDNEVVQQEPTYATQYNYQVNNEMNSNSFIKRNFYNPNSASQNLHLDYANPGSSNIYVPNYTSKENQKSFNTYSSEYLPQYQQASAGQYIENQNSQTTKLAEYFATDSHAFYNINPQETQQNLSERSVDATSTKNDVENLKYVANQPPGYEIAVDATFIPTFDFNTMQQNIIQTTPATIAADNNRGNPRLSTAQPISTYVPYSNSYIPNYTYRRSQKTVPVETATESFYNIENQKSFTDQPTSFHSATSNNYVPYYGYQSNQQNTVQDLTSNMPYNNQAHRSLTSDNNYMPLNYNSIKQSSATTLMQSSIENQKLHIYQPTKLYDTEKNTYISNYNYQRLQQKTVQIASPTKPMHSNEDYPSSFTNLPTSYSSNSNTYDPGFNYYKVQQNTNQPETATTQMYGNTDNSKFITEGHYGFYNTDNRPNYDQNAATAPPYNNENFNFASNKTIENYFSSSKTYSQNYNHHNLQQNRSEIATNLMPMGVKFTTEQAQQSYGDVDKTYIPVYNYDNMQQNTVQTTPPTIPNYENEKSSTLYTYRQPLFYTTANNIYIPNYNQNQTQSTTQSLPTTFYSNMPTRSDVPINYNYVPYYNNNDPPQKSSTVYKNLATNNPMESSTFDNSHVPNYNYQNNQQYGVQAPTSVYSNNNVEPFTTQHYGFYTTSDYSYLPKHDYKGSTSTETSIHNQENQNLATSQPTKIYGTTSNTYIPNYSYHKLQQKTVSADAMTKSVYDNEEFSNLATDRPTTAYAATNYLPNYEYSKNQPNISQTSISAITPYFSEVSNNFNPTYGYDVQPNIIQATTPTPLHSNIEYSKPHVNQLISEYSSPATNIIPSYDHRKSQATGTTMHSSIQNVKLNADYPYNSLDIVNNDTPNYNPLKQNPSSKPIYNNIENKKPIYQSTDSYAAESNTYVPNYNYKNLQQNTVPRPINSNKVYSKLFTSQPTTPYAAINNNYVPTYQKPQDLMQVELTTISTYEKLENPKLYSDQSTTVSDNPTNSNHGSIYRSHTAVNNQYLINYGNVQNNAIHLISAESIYDKIDGNNLINPNNLDEWSYQKNIVGSHQQEHSNNPIDLNDSNQYNLQENEYSYAKNFKTLEKPPHTRAYNSPELQEHNLSYRLDKSTYPVQDVSAQNLMLKQPHNSKEDVVVQPPESYSIENTNNSEFDIKSNKFSKQNILKLHDNIPTKNGNQPEDIIQPVTTLEDVENDEYKMHFNPERSSTLRAIEKITQDQEKVKTPIKNLPNEKNIIKNYSIDKNKENLKKHNDTEALFKGLEQIILKNEDKISDSLETNTENTNNYNKLSKANENEDESQKQNNKKNPYKNLNKNVETTPKELYGQTEVLTTERNTIDVQSKQDPVKNNFSKNNKHVQDPNEVQAVDESPSVVFENYSERDPLNYREKPESKADFNKKKDQISNAKEQNINEALLQNAIKKVINNFVPGKAQDLMANFGNSNKEELVGANIENLHPEILGSPILKNLFSLPEVENMITDTASSFLSQITRSSSIGNIPYLIRNALRNVVDQIPHPHPTVAPMTVEEHQIKDGEWVTERITLLEKSPIVAASKNPPKEVFDKIRSIINRSALEEQVAAQPIIENLIIKTVKHSLDKEKGIIDESTIRRAFNLLVEHRTPTTEKISVTKGKDPVIQQSKVTSDPNEDSYSIAPIIHVTEHVLHGDKWFESQKNLVPKKPKNNSDFSEDKKKILQEKLEEQKFNKTRSENETMEHSSLETKNIVGDPKNLKTITAKSLNYANLKEEKENTSYENVKSSETIIDDSIERKPIKYYSPNDRILEYIKNHSTERPLSTAAEIIGQSEEYHNVEATTRGFLERTPVKLLNYGTSRVTQNHPVTLNSASSLVQYNQADKNPMNVFNHESTFVPFSQVTENLVKSFTDAPKITAFDRITENPLNKFTYEPTFVQFNTVTENPMKTIKDEPRLVQFNKVTKNPIYTFNNAPTVVQFDQITKNPINPFKDVPTRMQFDQVTANPINTFNDVPTRMQFDQVTANPINTFSDVPTRVQFDQIRRTEPNVRQFTQVPNTINYEKPAENMVSMEYNNEQFTNFQSSNEKWTNHDPLNLLVEPTTNSFESSSQATRNQNTMEGKSVRQSNSQLNLGQVLHVADSTFSKFQNQNVHTGDSQSVDPPYFGRLVPMDYPRASQPNDLSDLQDSNLMYIGDGVRLPLTIRKLQDGTFALTLADEVCKRFIHKKCPCCLPNDDNGIILREKRNGETISFLNFKDEEPIISQEAKDTNSNMSRVRRESDETIQKTLPIVSKNRKIHKIPKLARQRLNIKQDSEENSKIPSKISKLARSTSTSVSEKNDENNKQSGIIDNQPRFEKRYRNSINKKVKSRKKKMRYGNENISNINLERRRIKSKYNYQTNNPLFIIEVTDPTIPPTRAIRRQTISPYRHQRQTGEGVTASSRTEALKNMLNRMKQVWLKPRQDS